MPGFRHPPSADIQRIRQDLRDRYQDGFPILKELLQNADDAGAAQLGQAATQCVFVLCEQGLPDAQHALLRGPGLAVVNDGSFTPEDANSITSLGLSNKAAQTAAAGKFGLGLKSVFHWAEACFYFSPHTFGGDPSTQSPGHDLLNPWSSRDTNTGRHLEWDEEWLRTRAADSEAFCSLVSATLHAKRWFGLWIPLRSQQHTHDGSGPVQPIENRFPSPQLDALFGLDWRCRLAETLPLLRRLHTVRICKRAQNAWEAVAEIRLGHDARRMGFGVEGGLLASGGNKCLLGRVETAGDLGTISFAGTESYPESPTLAVLRNSSAWPSQSALGPDGADLQVKEKAEPHGAVVFTREAKDSQGVLRVQPAVFLPLGEPELVTCKGRWRYNLYLHGFFFVDSGRRQIQDDGELPESSEPGGAESESEVIRLWNRVLMREVVAPLVLPSLDAFARQEQMELEEAESLVGSLQGSKTLKKLTAWMCEGQRFIHRLRASGSQWVLEKYPAQEGESPRWVELPAPEFLETELFRFLPGLTALSGRVSVSLKGKPSLADHKPTRLSDEELAELLGSVAVSAFDDARQLDYLLKLIPEDTNQRSSDSLLTTSLVKLANQLVSRELPKDRALHDQWHQFFRRLPAKAFIRLPCDSTKVGSEIARVIAEVNLPIAVLWQDFREAEGQGTLGWNALLPVLRRMGILPLTDEPAIRQRCEITLRLLKVCALLPQNWTATIADFPLFHTHWAGSPTVAASIVDLRAAHAEARLFTGGDPWATDLTKAAPEARPLLVDKAITEILGLAVSDCGATACVKLLRTAARVADEFASRKPLFVRLLSPANQISADALSALRGLLHGQISQWEQTAALFCECDDHQVFLALARMALGAAGQPWRLVPASVASQLRLDDQQRTRLNLLSTSAAHIEALVIEVGPERVDRADLSRENCDVLLQRFNDVVVLRGLNIHDTLDDRRVRIGKHTYVDDGTFTELPPAFDQLVTRIRDNPNYARFTCPDGTNRLVIRLSWEAVIEIALGQDNPADWAASILTAIGRLGNLRSELKRRVQEAVWIPLADGDRVAPKTLLHVPGAEAELDLLLDEILADHIPLLRLAQSVRQHERFETFKNTIPPSATEALATLSTLLKLHAGWSTGLSCEWPADQITDWVQTFDDASEQALVQALPVARMVKAFHCESPVRELLPGFLSAINGRLSEIAYANVLTHLAGVHETADANARQRAESVFLRYLKAIAAAGPVFSRNVLACEGVRLMSEAGKWKSPTLLAFPTNGVTPEDILCQPQAEALVSLNCSRLEMTAGGDAIDEHERVDVDLRETAERLREYFSLWTEIVPREVIGAFLCILGDEGGIRNLAEQFLGQRTVDGTRAEIAALATCRTAIPLVHAFATYRFACVVHGEPTSNLPSVLGEPFEAHLGGEIETIFFGHGVHAFPVAKNWSCRRLHLLLFELVAENSSPERLANLLRASAEAILSYVFGQTGISLRPLWDKLSRPSQLHIRIAQNRVLEAAQAFLRQVGAHRTEKVRRVLQEWDTADRSRAEAEENNRQVPQEVGQQLAKAKQQLRELLARDEWTQRDVLTAVRHKMKQYQYDPSSVPFELWQNADDAVVELDLLEYDTTGAEGAGFVVERSSHVVAFAHWGRLINEFQGVSGHALRERGFDQDLEKMVIQSISDKRPDDHLGPAVTGKFGLGFKSVFLISDAPEVLSGHVDFVIRGGVYPVRLEDAQRTGLEATLQNLTPDDRRCGTIIRLALRADDARETGSVLSSFERLASLLVVFSRRLKRLRLRVEGQPEREVHWRPHLLLDGVEVGASDGLDANVKSALVFFRPSEQDRDRLQFLLGLSNEGVVPLPDDVPGFWVTAPTRETQGYGFAVNGPFEPDVGRVQLALKSVRNQQLADELAQMLNARLQSLWQKAHGTWETLRPDLHLASSVSPRAFWQSLWDVLGTGFARSCPTSDDTTVAQLARRILWASEAAGLRRFYCECAALPTGLWGQYRALTCLPDLRHVASGALDRESTFTIVSGWLGFRQRVLVGNICSGSQVESTLARMGVHLEADPVYLANAVEWELGQDCRADPGLALRLGQLVTPEFLKNLQAGKPGERDEQEHKALSGLLGGVEFQAADGSWHKPTELVIATDAGVEPDETMRAAFAPRECLLNQAYVGHALAFFLACRPRLVAEVETMATWVLQAGDEMARSAALRYLLEGAEALRHRLAAQLQQTLGAGGEVWLIGVEQLPWWEGEFTEQERRELVWHILRLRKPEGTAPPPPPPPPPPPLERHIWTVEELWKWWEHQGKPMGDYTLEGEANWELFHGGRIPDEQERKAELKRLLRSDDPAERNPYWYRLFGYACLISAGRHTTELREFWKKRLNAKQFWERTSSGDFSEETIEIFEQAVTTPFREAAYYWRRVFYDVRKVHRMVCVNDFPSDLMRLVNEGHGQHLREFLSYGRLPYPGQQRWVGTFGQSSGSPLGFIIRELMRLEVITDELVRPSAFFVCRPVLRALSKIGRIDDEEEAFSGEDWLAWLAKDQVHGPRLLPYYDIPLLHMGLTHRGDRMPVLPR